LSGVLPDIPPSPIWQASVDWTHHQGFAEIKVKTDRGTSWQSEIPASSRLAIADHMLATLWRGETQVIKHPRDIQIVGHRVVHGGAEYRQSTWVTPEVKAAIARLAAFAPVHNPANLEGIVTIEQALGDVPQVAVFDTAFHAHLPTAAYTYPIPYEFAEQGIRRYGFHGISHQYCTHRAAQILGRDERDLRLITCHLGNGCSLAAVHGGRSIDTTMGFTPLEGLMMGSRSGSIDPGILLHLLRQPDMTVDRLDSLLNRGSGLQGIAGVSSDMRQILQAIADGHVRAQLALEMYIHRLRSQIGAMLASLGGLDALVFTAGIGENAAIVRAGACQAFGFLGLELDADKNAQSPMDCDIATSNSPVRVLVIHTQEDWEIARECWRLAQTHPTGSPEAIIN
jgi:acetate kinase